MIPERPLGGCRRTLGVNALDELQAGRRAISHAILEVNNITLVAQCLNRIRPIYLIFLHQHPTEALRELRRLGILSNFGRSSKVEVQVFAVCQLNALTDHSLGTT
jgi:hypothetical protein